MSLFVATLLSAVAAPVTLSPVTGPEVAPQRADLAMEMGDRQLQIRLERNDAMLGGDYREVRVSGDARRTLAVERPHCWYQGTILEGEEVVGRAALRTCDGRVHTEPAGWLRFDGADWALHGGDLQRLADAPPVAQRSSQRPPPDRTRWMELVVVNDAQQTAAKGGSPEIFALDSVNVLHALYRDQAFADQILVTLVGQVSHEGSTPFSAPMVGDEVDHHALLDAFDGWLEGESFTYDHVQLFTPQDFLDASLGLAHLGRMCGSLSSSIVQATHDEVVTATTSAHEIGHGFGMNHDSTDNSCTDEYIMAPSTVASEAQPTAFSDCSISQMDTFLGSQTAACLDTRPIEGGGVCGDGIIDAGEACDCGLSGCDGLDPCCDESTCQLAEGARCSALDPCCDDTCGIVPASANKVCRDRHPDCDVPETCDGVLPGCPADELAPAGDACRDDRNWQGSCHAARCVSYAGTCADVDELFPSSDVAWSRICEGTQNSQPCGNIICSFDGQGCSSATRSNGERIQVYDGTVCGTGQQCLEGACVPSSDLDLVDDLCPFDPAKAEPGLCGCGALDFDGDGDGTVDCLDGCPLDGDKLEPGECGCGEAEPVGDLACGEEPTTEPPEEEEKTGGCACASGTPAVGWWMLAGLVAYRRRRPQQCSRESMLTPQT